MSHFTMMELNLASITAMVHHAVSLATHIKIWKFQNTVHMAVFYEIEKYYIYKQQLWIKKMCQFSNTVLVPVMVM